MIKLSSKTQFRLGTGLILFIFCLTVSLIVYRIGKEEAEQRVFKETEIYIAAVDATRMYVKDVLRPRMYGSLRRTILWSRPCPPPLWGAR